MESAATVLATVLSMFPMHEFAVRRAYSSDADFQALCEDFAVASRAFERWKENKEIAKQYSQVISELEDEILEFIERRHPRQVGRSDTKDVGSEKICNQKR